MAAPVLFSTALDGDGVLVATLDMPGRTMNVFSADLMDALDALMDRVDADGAVRAVVVTSGKPTFLAGADLVMVRGYTEGAKTATRETMFGRCGRLGRQFVRLEESAKPWVAAINGIALGGGLELALACRERVVADDAKLQLGVPEVRWGLLPGAGGTQRLPRMAGFEAAMELLLTGRSIDPATALGLHVVDAVVPRERLLDAAKARARELVGRPLDPAAKYANLAEADVPPASEDAIRETTRRVGISDDDVARYPAFRAIAGSVLEGARRPLAEATAVEMHRFLDLMFDPTAGRMVRTLFLERLRAERELAAPADGAGAVEASVGAAGRSEGSDGSDAAWRALLARAKPAVSTDPALAPATLQLVEGPRRARFALGTIDGATPDTLPFAVLGRDGPYGRVVEVVGADDEARALVAAFAARLRLIAWPTPGPTSVLQRLAGRPLAEQAGIALEAAADARLGDLAFLDVAACLSGASPAWSGGPLAWLWDERAAGRLDPVTAKRLAPLETRLAQAMA